MDKEILHQQRNEITEHHIYSKLADLSKDEHNKKILKRISNDELKHHNIWKKITGVEVKPKWFDYHYYVFVSRVFGLSFGLKLMERGEGEAQDFYDRMSKKYPVAKAIERDEVRHEKDLINMLNDERLKYASSIVLGLNDALVELTGTLAGLTLAFANSKIIGVTGLVLGLAASLSMAASEFLSSREEESENPDKSSIKSAIYTGVAYIITVMILVIPYFTMDNVYYSLAVMLALAITIIFSYTYYISVAKDVKFLPRFLGMAAISLGVAVISFAFGYVLKVFFGIEV